MSKIGEVSKINPDELESVADTENEYKYGDTTGQVKAGLAGLARGATLGLSDVALTKSGLVNPETLKGLQEENPISSIAGEVGSIFIPGGVLTHGVEALNEARVAAGAGEKLTKASGLGNSVVSRLGEAAASGIENKVANKAIQYGTEGALYGAGQSISESALGEDHDLIGAQTLANIGISSVLGAGLGSVVGKLSKEFPSKAESLFGAEKIAQDAEVGTAEHVIANSNLSPDEKMGVLNLGKTTARKEGAETLVKEFDEYGLPIVPGQLAKDETVQKMSSAMGQLPGTSFSQEFIQALSTGFEKIQNGIKNIFGAEEHLDAATNGFNIKEQIKQKLRSIMEPINKAYAEREAVGSGIKISEDAVKESYDKILDLSKNKELFKSVTTEGRDVLKNEAENFFKEASAASPMAGLDEYAKGLGAKAYKARVAGDRDLATAYQSLQDIVENFRDYHLDQWGEKEAVQGYKELKKEYSELKRVFGSIFGEKFGKKVTTEGRINDALNKIADEKFVDKFFDKKNAKRMNLIKDKFPEVFDTLVQARKSQFYIQATKGGKELNPLSLIKGMHNEENISKGVRDLIFDKAQRKELEVYQKWIEELPNKIGKTGTPEGMAWLEFGKNPIKGIASAVLNEGASRLGGAFIKSIDRGEAGATLKTLINIDRAAKKTTDKIKSGVSGIINNKGSLLLNKGLSMSVGQLTTPEEYDKTTKEIKEFANNDQLLHEKIDQSTNDLYAHAPMVTSAIQVGAIRGIQFLASKLSPDNDDGLFHKDTQKSPTEINKFNRYYTVANDPFVVFHQMKNGNLPNESLETLSAVHPRIYDEMKNQVYEQLTATKDRAEIPYQTKLLLSKFMGEPMVKSLLPQNIMANQAQFQQAMQQAQANNQPKARPGQMKDMTLSSRTGLSKNDEV